MIKVNTESESKPMKYSVIGTEVNYLNLKEYMKAQRIKEKAKRKISEDIIIVLFSN